MCHEMIKEYVEDLKIYRNNHFALVNIQAKQINQKSVKHSQVKAKYTGRKIIYIL